MINKKLYNVVALGGTFDHLHDGHKEFLLFASGLGKSLIIGVTDQHMTLQKPFAHLIQPTHIRKQAVRNFCNQNNITAKLITLLDPYGPTIEENEINALACTTGTIAGADKINEIRNKLHFTELPIHIHQLKKDSLGTGIISAERIRAGEIDRKGVIYSTALQSNIHLSEKQREFFTHIQGKIVTEPTSITNQKTLRIVVGDTCLENFISNNWHYDLGIFDFKRQRKTSSSKVLEQLDSVEHIKNDAGTISTDITQKITDWLENNSFQHIFVEGEEDLSAVSAILLTPLGTQIYYGQPNIGMVECTVSENLKVAVYSVLVNKPNL